jgi:hypothetical protein
VGAIMKIELNKYGWDCYGIVRFKQEWCVMCTKATYHEEMEGQKICIACTNIVEPRMEETAIQPSFQIERFIKEEWNG